MVAFYITSFKIQYIGMLKSCETLKKKDITNTIKVFFVSGI